MTIDAEIWAGLRVASSTFQLQIPQRQQRTAGGDVYAAGLGAPLWSGRAVLRPGPHVTQIAVEAALDRLRRPGQRLELWDTRVRGPRADPTAALLGPAVPQLLEVGGNAVRLTGLPPGYLLQRGDYLGWSYGASPVRRALHRVWTPQVVAGAQGITGWIEVEPLIRPGVPVSAVILHRPRLTAQIVSASYGEAVPMITDGAEIDWIQTFR